MELKGFRSKSCLTLDGERLVEYFAEDGGNRKSLKLRVNDAGNLIVEYMEDGCSPGVVLGERITSPVRTEELEKRLLNAMASYHFGADWLDDGFTLVDLEMVRRGYEVGKIKSGELIWYRRENGATLIVKREESDQLPGSFSDSARLVVVGVTGKELVVNALDYKSLVSFIETNAHYQLYQPHQDIRINGIYDADGITEH